MVSTKPSMTPKLPMLINRKFLRIAAKSTEPNMSLLTSYNVFKWYTRRSRSLSACSSCTFFSCISRLRRLMSSKALAFLSATTRLLMRVARSSLSSSSYGSPTILEPSPRRPEKPSFTLKGSAQATLWGKTPRPSSWVPSMTLPSLFQSSKSWMPPSAREVRSSSSNPTETK